MRFATPPPLVTIKLEVTCDNPSVSKLDSLQCHSQMIVHSRPRRLATPSPPAILSKDQLVAISRNRLLLLVAACYYPLLLACFSFKGLRV